MVGGLNVDAYFYRNVRVPQKGTADIAPRPRSSPRRRFHASRSVAPEAASGVPEGDRAQEQLIIVVRTFLAFALAAELHAVRSRERRTLTSVEAQSPRTSAGVCTHLSRRLEPRRSLISLAR